MGSHRASLRTCRFSGVGGEYVTYRFGTAPPMRSPDGYVMCGEHLLQRLTLEGDGGMAFACSGFCRNKVLPKPSRYPVVETGSADAALSLLTLSREGEERDGARARRALTARMGGGR